MFANEELSDVLKIRQEYVDESLRNYLEGLELPGSLAVLELRQAMKYSLLQRGKRFRPTVIFLLSEAFGHGPQRVLPFACAVEMIHTYSLIHDDLPCMDDDDLRRGEPTNHKIYGEGLALLAGDALLTEAFTLLAMSYVDEPQISVRLIELLGRAAGARGMVAGQALDMKARGEVGNLEELLLMHSLKTGALIRACAEGAAMACGLPQKKVELARSFGESLGLAFQLKDDLLDSSESTLEVGSVPALIGLEKTQQYLQRVSTEAVQALAQLGIQQGPLKELIFYNQNRKL